MQVTTPWREACDPRWWHRTVTLGAGLLAAVLAASALVSWVASNWSRMGPQDRLALVQGGLILAVVLAAGLAWRGSRWAGLLAGVAALATGALLALVGQIYQTGADRWQLFLLWAALITPWVLLLRSAFLVLLWAAVLNTAAWLFLGAGAGRGFWQWLDADPAMTGAWLLALNGGLLALAEWARPCLRDPWRLVRRILAAAVLGWAFQGALLSMDFSGPSQLARGVALGLAPVAILYGAYRYGFRDLAVVTLSLLTGIGVVGALLGRMLDSLDGVLGLAVLLLALALGAVRHVLRLRRTLPMGARPAPGASTPEAGLSIDAVLDIDAGVPDPAEAPDPWYLTVLRMGALFPVLVLLGVWVAASFDLHSAADALSIGAMLMLPGLLMDRLAGRAAWRDIGGVLTALGLLLCAGSVLFLMDASAGRVMRLLIMAAAGTVAYVFSRQFVVRLMAALLVLGIAFWLSGPDAAWLDWPGDPQGLGTSQLAWRLWAFLATGAALWAWSARASHRAAWRPLAWALMAMAASVSLLIALSAQTSARDWPWFGLFAMLLCAVLPGLLLAAWMAAVRPALPAGLRMGAPLAACVAGLGWVDVPALSVALVWLVLGRLSAGRALQVLAAPLGLLGLLLYYLNAHAGIQLVDKAIVLGVTAAWLAGLALALAARRNRDAGHRPSGARRLPVGMLAAGVLALGVAQAQIHRYEAILAQGRPVVLALAPVDPRSLMQGDYMALDYAVRRAARDWLRLRETVDAAVRGTGRGWLLLRRDGQDVWQLQGVTAARPPAATPDAVALAFRWHADGPDFGARDWFFPEGQGDRFANARYGVLRVADDGTALLAELLDEDRRALVSSE